MANINKASGLSPVKYLNGAPWNGQANLYYIVSGETNNIYIGDPVKSSGSGSAVGVAGITLATGGHAPNPIRGVVIAVGGLVNGGFVADPTNLGQIYVKGTTTKDFYALVVDDPNVVFEVQEVSGGTQLAAVDIGLNCDLVAAAGNGYVSGWMLDNANKATTATYQCRLLGLAQRTDNAFGAYAKWLVQINQHELGHGTGQIGV